MPQVLYQRDWANWERHKLGGTILREVYKSPSLLSTIVISIAIAGIAMYWQTSSSIMEQAPAIETNIIALL